MLALDLDISMTKKDGVIQLALFDCTGIYDATINPTGWGAPNDDITTAGNVELNITMPNGDFYQVGLPDFPNTDGQYYYLTSLDILGTAGDLPDGKYEFVYRLQAGVGTIYTQEITKYFYCNVECCLQNKAAGLDLSKCTCNGTTSEIDETLEGWAALKALKAQVALEQYDNADETLAHIQRICNIDTICNPCK